MDKEQFNARQRKRRQENGNANTRKYEKTVKGFLMRSYRNMQSRVNGVQWKKQHLYAGKYLLSRDEFYKWANESPTFHALYSQWASLNYIRRFTPSVDRVNSSIGYTLENMEWVEFHENCRRGASKKRTK